MSHFYTLVILERDKMPIEEAVEELLAPYSELIEVPEYDRACSCEGVTPDCAWCEGKGTYKSTRNPQSKWDWWVIGGRWDGWLLGAEFAKACETDNGFNFSESNHTVRRNCRNTNDIPWHEDHYIPFAIVTPDGKWHEKGEMWWWAIVVDKKSTDDWNKVARELLAQYPDHLAVCVDCHI